MLMDNDPPSPATAPEGRSRSGLEGPEPRSAATGPVIPTASARVLRRGVFADGWWRMDALLWVGLGLLVSFSLGLVVASVLKVKAEDLFAGMAITALCLHGAILILVPTFLWAYHLSWSEAFGFGASGPVRAVLLGAGATVLALPVAWALGWLSADIMRWFHVVPVPQKAVMVVQESVSLGPQVFMAGMAIVLAPVAEEIFFRGVLYPALRLPQVLRWSRVNRPAQWVRRGPCRWLGRVGLRRLAAWLRAGPSAWLLIPRPWLAAGITSLAFGAFHVNTMTFLSLSFFGLVLSWLYEQTGNLLTPIFSHSLFNLANFFLLVWARPTT